MIMIAMTSFSCILNVRRKEFEGGKDGGALVR